MHEDKKVFEIEVKDLGKIQLFVDPEQHGAWIQVVPSDPIFEGTGWAFVRRCNGQLKYGAVNAAPSSF